MALWPRPFSAEYFEAITGLFSACFAFLALENAAIRVAWPGNNHSIFLALQH